MRDAIPRITTALREADIAVASFQGILPSNEAFLESVATIPANVHSPDLAMRMSQYDDPERERERQTQHAMMIGLAKVLVNRCFVVTEGERVCVGPKTTIPGDLIVAFRGGGTPFVVRLHQDHHILVQGCHAPSIMDEQLAAWSAAHKELMLHHIPNTKW